MLSMQRQPMQRQPVQLQLVQRQSFGLTGNSKSFDN